MVIPVLPEVQRHLGTDARTVSWVVSGYLLAAAVATPILGRLGDRVGKKPILLVTLGALAGGSVVCAFATTTAVMMVGRLIQGCGSAVIPLAYGIVRDEFPAPRVPSRIGIIAALTGIGAALGLVFAGPIFEHLGYVWMFLIPAAVCAATAVGAMVTIRSIPGRGTPIAWLPAPFLIVFLTTFVIATTNASRWGWLSVATVALYLVSATFAALWWRIESRSANPLIDIAMIRMPTVRASNVVSFLLGVSLFVPYTFLPQILQTPRETGYGFGLTVTTSGLVLLPMSVAMVAGGLASARLVRRFAARSVLATTCGVMAGCILLFGVAHDAIWHLAITLVAYGFSMGIALAALAALIVVSVPIDQSAVAGAVNFNIRNLAAAVGVALMATIVTSTLGPTGLPLDSGYRLGFGIMAAGAAAAAVLALTIPARQRTSTAA